MLVVTGGSARKSVDVVCENVYVIIDLASRQFVGGLWTEVFSLCLGHCISTDDFVLLQIFSGVVC